MPFQPGNKYGKGRPPAGHSFSDALRIAVAQKDERGSPRIRAIAEALVDKAVAGDVQAIREIADRLEGRPALAKDETPRERPIVIHMTEADLRTM